MIAVVTGAGSGIGRAVALRLAAGGARVAAADIDLAAATETARMAGGPVQGFEVDVADSDRVDALRAEVRGELGRPTVLVNAAGWDRTAPFLDVTADFARRVVEINYLGQVHMCRAFLADMVQAGEGGRVVNIGSDAGRVGSSGESVYAGAKGGVIALTKSLAREMARHGITVNCVCPGPTDTPLFRAQPDKLQEALVRAIPMRRPARPDEVAGVVEFFVGDAAGYVTGQVLSVNGGLTMAD